MNDWGDIGYEMQRLGLDDGTADRLLAGQLAPEDAPPGYGPVVRLLAAASAEPAAEELQHEQESVVALALALRSSEPATFTSFRRFSMPLALTRVRLVAAAAAVALAATASLASAGSLPGAAQDIASEMLAKLGISVPGPKDSAGTHPDVRGGSGTASGAPSAGSKASEISDLAKTTEATGVDKGAAVSTAASEGKSQAGEHGSARAASTAGKGADISELARTTEATGVEKGAAVSTAASEGKSQAGEQGSASEAAGGSAPVAAPNGGGTETADAASGGQSSNGTSTADAASGGHSSAGSGNAASGQSHRP